MIKRYGFRGTADNQPVGSGIVQQYGIVDFTPSTRIKIIALSPRSAVGEVVVTIPTETGKGLYGVMPIAINRRNPFHCDIPPNTRFSAAVGHSVLMGLSESESINTFNTDIGRPYAEILMTDEYGRVFPTCRQDIVGGRSRDTGFDSSNDASLYPTSFDIIDTTPSYPEGDLLYTGGSSSETLAGGFSDGGSVISAPSNNDPTYTAISSTDSAAPTILATLPVYDRDRLLLAFTNVDATKTEYIRVRGITSYGNSGSNWGSIVPLWPSSDFPDYKTVPPVAAGIAAKIDLDGNFSAILLEGYASAITPNTRFRLRAKDLP